MIPRDHVLLLGVVASLDVDPGETSAEVNLTLVCDDESSECLWRIKVPTDKTGELVVTLSPELLAELHASHDKYWDAAWDGQGWSFGKTPREEIPQSLTSSTTRA